jgi:hypothetical protein
MKTKLFHYIGLFLIGIIAFSCKSNFVVLTIENSLPASEELPKDIQSLTLMNRSMNSQFENFQEDSLQIHFYRKGFQLSKIVLDSLASDTTIRALADLLFESGRYDVVVPLERNIRRNISYELLPDTLPGDSVKAICEAFNTDALMVLEKFSTKVLTDISKERLINATTSIYHSYYASMDIKYDAFFRIYRPGQNHVIREIRLVDTIYWESADYTQVKLFQKLPSVKQGLINASIKVALEVDEKLSPAWIPEKRGYFLLDQKNDRGQQFMSENKYDEAAQYWREMAGSKNKMLRSKAEYNLALISELNGDLDRALEWGLKSFYSYYRYQTEAYLKKLKERKETLQKTN